MHKESRYAHIWEGDYARREGFIKEIRKLNYELPEAALTGAAVYYSDIPYDLRLFLHLSFNPFFEGIDEIILRYQEAMLSVAKLRGDITPEKLSIATMQRQLNMMTLIQQIPFRDPCKIPSLTAFESKGYRRIDWGTPKNRVFLSHQSERKTKISKLQMLLNDSEIPTWFDAIDINYGDSIVTEIERGIEHSSAVIFWISPKFIESNWCQFEFEAFLHNYASSRSTTIIPIVEQGLEDRIPKAISRIKYIPIDTNTPVEDITSELLSRIRQVLKD